MKIHHIQKQYYKEVVILLSQQAQIYYPVEKWLARCTDVLITINEEDYNRAKKFKAKRVEKINGIGVNEQKFHIEMTEEEENKLKEEFKINKNDIVLTYVGELNSGKNQVMLMEAVKEILKEHFNIKLLLVGKGKLEQEYKAKIAELGIEKYVVLTGYRRDVPKIFKITDIAVSTSKREGLPINLVEAQMSGLPIIATNVRGNNELAITNENGFIVESKEEVIEKIKFLIENENIRKDMGKESLEKSKKYRLEDVLKEMDKIYNKK